VAKSQRLFAGTRVEVVVPEASAVREPELEPEVQMDIMYQDDDVVIVDKPVGVAAHASAGWTGPTVLGALLAQGVTVTTSGAPERRGIVQRLDVGTSGLMVVAKSESAYTGLKQAFRDRTPKKIYHAVCQGYPEHMTGTIDAPIGRHPTNDWKFTVRADGRASVTHYEVMEMLPSATLCEVRLETGRTHQIRVHFAALRHPLLGDITYGADPVLAESVGLAHQWLHSQTLGFTHPITGVWTEVSSEYPADLAAALEILRG
jgi:23S rRNA pseudouridine1911/1915/1917 synthase